MNFLNWLLPVLVIAWTIWGIFDYRRLKVALARGDRSALLREYRITVAGEVVGGILAVAAVGAAILEAPEIGFRPSGATRSILPGALAGMVLGLVAAPLISRFSKNKGNRPVLVGDIAALVPRASRERAWYALVALSAGVGEELIFRGFLMRLLADAGLDGVLLVAVAAVIFGLAHVYQGAAGVLVTTLLGAFFGVLYVATGSLVLPMVVHILMDLRLLAVKVPETQVN